MIMSSTTTSVQMESSKNKDEKLPIVNTRPVSKTFLSKGPIGVAYTLVNLFSTFDGKRERDDDDDDKKQHVRLITITASHFCEKGRWGLDLLEQKGELVYTEDCHPPAFHAFATLPASNYQASVTPMVVVNEDKVIHGSDKVLQELCPFLYPPEIANEIIAIEDDLAQRLGAPLRCLWYHEGFTPEYMDLTKAHLSRHASKVERKLFTAMLDKGISDAMKKSMGITAKARAVSEESIRKVFAEYSDRLSKNGGNYLMDAPDGSKSYGFTAADLTFAALAFPLLRPPCMMPCLVECEADLPLSIVQLARDMRQTLAGQHALRMYEQHRPTRTNGRIALQTVNRDRFPYKELFGLVGVTTALAVAVFVATRGKAATA